MKLFTCLLVLVGSSAVVLANGMKDEGAVCGGSGSSVGTVFQSTLLGSQIGCKVNTLAVVNGSGGTYNSGGSCGTVDWPQHLSGNGCGPDKKGATAPE